MATRAPSLRLGIEEEYLLIDPVGGDLVRSPDPAFMAACRDALGGQVTHELMQAQVEVATRPSDTVAAAHAELARLRRTVAEAAQAHGMAILAASTHPFASWTAQQSTDKKRYRELTEDLQMLARRQLIGGMHIHAGIEDENVRIDLMNQVAYFLPHFLALSTSSPFWAGHDTGLKAYRPTVSDGLPRSGTPERLASWREWQQLLETLAETGLVDDPTQIWWDVRPSARHPTVELRVTDICTDLRHAASLAALFQSLLHHLWRLRTRNQAWRSYRRILIEENKWRAQRRGVEAELADFAAGTVRPVAELVSELIELLQEDARELGCSDDLEGLRTILAEGTSADRQLAIYRAALDQGARPADALLAVVQWLATATLEGTAEPV
jgi:carboxylate-amine ligase